MTPTDPTGALSLRDLDRALARISEQQRQVILLIGTIRSRLSRGREALRTLMDRRDATELANRAAIHERAVAAGN